MPDVISIIAARLCTGEPLHRICQDPDMPSLPMLYAILRSDADARAVIDQARQDAAHTLAWQMIEIADEPMIGTETTTEQEGATLVEAGENGEIDAGEGVKTKTKTKTYDNVARTAQRLRAREWLAKRLCPASYADRIEQHQTGAQSLTIITGVPDPDGTDADANEG